MICQMGLMCHCCATSEANRYSILNFLDFVSHALVLSTAFVVLLGLHSVNTVPETTFEPFFEEKFECCLTLHYSYYLRFL